MSRPGAPTLRWTLSIAQTGGAPIRVSRFTQIRVIRDLTEIAGQFEIALVDQAAIQDAFPTLVDAVAVPAIRAGRAVILALDGETVLTGYVDRVTRTWSGEQVECRITGRDRTGDLVDCAGVPTGPAEFRGVDLLAIARQVCAPFGITVTADVDVGAPFDRLAVSPHETAFQLIEKAARQRAVLPVSDGVGGLRLTRGGRGQAPAPLVVGAPAGVGGATVLEAETSDDWSRRFSDVYIKGQSERAAGHRSKQAAVRLTHDYAPFQPGTVTPAAPLAPLPAGQASATERHGVVMTGHATDPDITRYRPAVRSTRTQSGASTVTEQAEWAVRVARGEATVLRYTVLGWRAGPPAGGRPGTLWRPNERTALTDPYAGFAQTMLVAGCVYTYGPEGERTQLRVVGLSAYDRIDEAERRQHTRRPRGPASNLDLR